MSARDVEGGGRSTELGVKQGAVKRPTGEFHGEIQQREIDSS